MISFAFSFFFSFLTCTCIFPLLSFHIILLLLILSDLKQREAVLALFSASAIDVFTSLIQVSSLSLFSLSPLLPSFFPSPSFPLTLSLFCHPFLSSLPLISLFPLLISPCLLSSTFCISLILSSLYSHRNWLMYW